MSAGMANPDPSLAVALVALVHPDRYTGQRFALVMADGTCIAFARKRDARGLIYREQLNEVSLPELMRHGL